jgi:hypothetical protein
MVVADVRQKKRARTGSRLGRSPDQPRRCVPDERFECHRRERAGLVQRWSDGYDRVEETIEIS